MVFQFQKVSNYGTSTPAVARTLLQGSEILRFFSTPEDQKDAAKVILQEIQRHLVRCVELRDRIAGDVKAGRNQLEKSGLEFQSGGRAVTLPGVADLQSNAESFLQSAKLAIRETARLVEPFYKEKHDHRFQKLASWARTKFGESDDFTKAIKHWEPWVKRIIDMRNAVDHPRDQPGGKLFTQNFRLTGTHHKPDLLDPTWNLAGEPESQVLPDMDNIIEGIIRLGEEILVGLFYKLACDFPFVIYEIPVEQRDPSCPTRLRVTLRQDIPSSE